jgi:hypothetical protein
MPRALLALILAAALAAGCSTRTVRPGSPDVYARIAAETDCAKLQEQFDLAEQTSKREGSPAGATWLEIEIAYMHAAEDRMREVGCYG